MHNLFLILGGRQSRHFVGAFHSVEEALAAIPHPIACAEHDDDHPGCADAFCINGDLYAVEASR